MVAKRIDVVSHGDVYAVAFMDESQVIGGYRNGYIRRWKIEDGQQQGLTMQGSGECNILAVSVSRDGRWIVTGDDGRKVIAWNAATHEKALEFTEDMCPVFAVDISSDSTRIASVDGKAVQIFSITSGTRLLPLLPHDHVVSVKFSPNGRRFATASFVHGFRIYNTHNGDILFDSGFECSTDPWPVSPLAWSCDGQQLFIGSRGKITCFNTSDSSSSEWPVHEARSPVFITSNGKFIAYSAGSSVSLWDCVSHKQIGSIITHSAEIISVALSPSGGCLVCGLQGGKIVIHDLNALPLKYFGHDLHANVFFRRPIHTCQLPLLQVSDEPLQSWTQDDLTHAELLLSEEITSTSSPSHFQLANRALIRSRLKCLALAVEDARGSLQVQPSPIGYIAMAVALLGRGDQEGARCTFDLAFHDCEPYDNIFLLLLKSILVFECGNQDEAISRVECLAARANDNNDDEAIYLYIQVLGVMHMKKGNYGRAIPLIERARNLAPKDKQCLPLRTISLIFGWTFNRLDIVSQQRLCETLYAEERTAEAAEILQNIIRTSDEEIQGNKATAEWIADFTKKCVTTLEPAGDEAFESAKHDDAIAQYSAALPLGPPSLVGLYIQRSRARAAKGLWEDALQDANEAVKTDPSCPWGYEAKHAALHGTKRYDEAIDAFQCMLHVIEQSQDAEIRQLRRNYISPTEANAAIDGIVRQVLESYPLVVIDVATGCLCDGAERVRIFKAHPSFMELVSSMTREVDSERILPVVTSFFRYAMLSHVSQENEPSFRDVNIVGSARNLPDTPPSEGLRNFCKEARRLGHNWAWSYTCCVDKTTSSIHNLSLTCMYKWYADSAATLVFLDDVAHPSKPGDLVKSLWMTQAWTLQELLAPKVILFYDSEWKPYLGDTGANHKKSPEIIQELADAIKIPHGTITTFTPDGLAIREKLRLASTRNARYVEDVAYSLIGIFKSDIRPHYGEGADALGHLLEEIVARFGDVTVLAWSGKSSSYNSCLPASTSAYGQTPYNPPPLEREEMETCIAELRGKLPQLDALNIYNQINFLPPARFSTRRLHLPCIVFSVRRLTIQETCEGGEKVYRARVLGLGRVEFTTADELPLHQPQKLVFAHPWICYIRGPSDEDPWRSDSESVVDFDSNLEHDTGSDEAVPPSPLDVAPVPQIDDYTRALQMIARLGQPFNALLLVQQPNRYYKRVATENEIVVPGPGTDITPRDIRAAILEIL